MRAGRSPQPRRQWQWRRRTLATNYKDSRPMCFFRELCTRRLDRLHSQGLAIPFPLQRRQIGVQPVEPEADRRGHFGDIEKMAGVAVGCGSAEVDRVRLRALAWSSPQASNFTWACRPEPRPLLQPQPVHRRALPVAAHAAVRVPGKSRRIPKAGATGPDGASAARRDSPSRHPR